MKTIGIISDTHIRAGGARQLPPRVFAAFAGVDFILHAGDLTSLHVLGDLEAIAPVFAVRGNNDGWDLQLPATRLLRIEGCDIGLTHGGVPAARRVGNLDVPGNSHTAGHALSHFTSENDVPTAHCVIFGHSHFPALHWHEVAGRKVLLFNPGSPTDRRYAPHFSLGLLRVDNTHLEPELLTW